MAAFAAILLLFSGCAGKAGSVSTDGSTSMQKVIGALSESFMAKKQVHHRHI